MKRNPLPQTEYLHELFWYDRIRGVLIWKIERGGKKVGDIAGAQRGSGYIQVGIDYKLYRAHLIIWKMMTGEEPPNFLDHENTIKNDNRWDNLREATKSQNQANIGLTKANTSGSKGASRYAQGEKWGKGWQSGIVKDGIHYHIGHFATKEEAHAAYMEKARELYGEFARAA